MDVRAILHRLVCLVFGCWMFDVSCRSALADPAYSIIDLGTGNPIFGTDSTGNGTVMASYGTAYTFNPVQNYSSALVTGATQPIPTVDLAPIWGEGDNGDPAYAFTRSTLGAMNSSGLAAGIDTFGVDGHLANSQAFVAQLLPNGSWSGATPLWSGATTMFGGTQNIGIIGVSSMGQVLGYGVQNANANYPITDLYLYDSKTGTTTDLSSLINAAGVPALSVPPSLQVWNWFANDVAGAQLDNQGRILLQANVGPTDLPPHELLLIPNGDPVTEAPVPEPGTIAIFAALIGGWVALNRRWSTCR